MSTREKVARWLCRWEGCPSWNALSNHARMEYEDAADDLLRVIYADGDAA